jgi:hypothetical protein
MFIVYEDFVTMRFTDLQSYPNLAGFRGLLLEVRRINKGNEG